jgi:hypothetical protein
MDTLSAMIAGGELWKRKKWLYFLYNSNIAGKEERL